jgi:hypothetical protein
MTSNQTAQTFSAVQPLHTEYSIRMAGSEHTEPPEGVGGGHGEREPARSFALRTDVHRLNGSLNPNGGEAWTAHPCYSSSERLARTSHGSV